MAIEETTYLKIEKSVFGTTSKGEQVDKYVLRNRNGMEVSVITFGGTITNWTAPNKEGVYQDIVLGLDSLSDYENRSPFFGAIIGRYGNRIANGKFELDGKEYILARNNAPNHLHGGEKGFDKVVWQAEKIKGGESLGLKLTYLSKDGEEGYPGNLITTVTYILTSKDKLKVKYEATTDKKTIVNLTQHSYFNLSANFDNTILDHKVMINADKFIPVSETLIPTGELRNVENTPFDFRNLKRIGAEINTENEQIKRGEGYDHCWVLNDQNKGVRLAATAYHPETRRLLEVYTDEPGIQLYTCNFMDKTLPQKGGIGIYKKRTGFCLETQHYPDSPNHPEFPNTILNPGETYMSQTTFKFSVK